MVYKILYSVKNRCRIVLRKIRSDRLSFSSIFNQSVFYYILVIHLQNIFARSELVFKTNRNTFSP